MIEKTFVEWVTPLIARKITKKEKKERHREKRGTQKINYVGQ